MGEKRNKYEFQSNSLINELSLTQRTKKMYHRHPNFNCSRRNTNAFFFAIRTEISRNQYFHFRKNNVFNNSSSGCLFYIMYFNPLRYFTSYVFFILDEYFFRRVCNFWTRHFSVDVLFRLYQTIHFPNTF